MPRVTQKGQVTIPKQIREALGIATGDEVTFHRTNQGTVQVVKVAPPAYFGSIKELSDIFVGRRQMRF